VTVKQCINFDSRTLYRQLQNCDVRTVYVTAEQYKNFDSKGEYKLRAEHYINGDKIVMS